MRIPIFPLQVVLFPGASLPLHIFEPRYKQMMQHCEATGLDFGVVYADPDGLAVVGCAAPLVRVIERHDDGRLDILTRGGQRFQILALDESEAYLQADVKFLDDDSDPAPRSLRESALALHFEALELMAAQQAELPHLQLDRPVSFLLADALPLPLLARQALLSVDSDRERTEMLVHIYDELLPQLRMQNADRQTGTSRLVH
jgi:Lon protease-like protein